MRTLVVVLLLQLSVSTAAFAGRNANGALIVHTNDSADYYSTSPEFCGYATPSTCEELNPNGTRDENQIIWLLAAFPSDVYPAVTAVRFGITHTFAGLFIDHAPCGPGGVESPEGNWPNGFGDGLAGNRVAFSIPVYDRLFAFYWLAVNLSGTDPAQRSFGTTFDPGTETAEFSDDSTPPSIDRCYNFGTMRWDGAGVNHCSLPLPTGACCLADHSCIVTTQLDCGHLNAAYRGDGTACDTNPCIPPTGACCIGDGTCREMTREDCARYTCTSYQGDSTSCADATCEPRNGACCFDDGSCVMELEAACNGAGGWFHCELVCDPDPCPLHMGACCFQDHCSFLPMTQCTAEGGYYGGDATNCDMPNPCPGGCCLPNHQCVVLHRPDCIAQGGIYRGDTSSCPDYACDNIGACCLADSTCFITDPSSCASNAGIWRGYTPCPPNPSCGWQGPSGICCVFPGCLRTTESECQAIYGWWWGPDVSCDACIEPATKRITWGGIKTLFR